MDPSASFSSPSQAVLLELILLGREHVLAVFPTGSGKTTLIFLLARMYALGKVIIVVLPLLSLHDDMHRRARLQGLKAAKFNAYEEFDRHANIVTVQVEALGTQGFKSYMASLVAENALYRIVCDEIHKPLTDIHFREAFSQLHTLNLFRTQIIGFTATLPPTLVRPLSEITNVQWHLLRQPSNRKELKFSIRRLPPTKVIDAAVKLAKATVENSKREERVLVYCNSKASCESVAEKIGCDFYHAGSDAAVVEDFLAGKHRALVCTTALNSGFHHEFVSLVIQIDIPYSLLDLLQAFGRGGRNG
ncbi:P-loop containing nucleoside triphosphate hydrolase protein, partial [Cristinia sonorae]